MDINGIEPGPRLAIYQVVERRPLKNRDQRGRKEKERQHAVVERENAKEAPHVEVAEVMGRAVVIIKNASDEKPGQDEKQLNAIGPVIRHANDGAFDPVAWCHAPDK